KEIDEGHLDGLAVNVPREIEDEGFEWRAGVVEHRLAIGGDADKHFAVEADFDGVDALGEAEGFGDLDVGGWETQIAAAPVALGDRAREEMVVAQKRIGGRDVAIGEGRADAGGGDGLRSLVEHVAELDRKALVLALGKKEFGRASPALSEMEIGAGHDARNFERIDEETGDEIFGF